MKNAGIATRTAGRPQASHPTDEWSDTNADGARTSSIVATTAVPAQRAPGSIDQEADHGGSRGETGKEERDADRDRKHLDADDERELLDP